MGMDRYLAGVLLSTLVVTSVSVTAIGIRRRLLPDWSGPPARLAEITIGISVVVGASELLGSFGLFRSAPFVILLTAAGLATYLFGWRTVDRTTAPATYLPAAHQVVRNEGWWERMGAVLAVALVAAEWSPGTINALRSGVSGIDSYWYHMPIAARFVQQGSITPLHNIGNDNVIAFYPASSELVHAVGIMLFRSDVLSPLINVGWLALALFAAWCLGRRFGVASLALIAAAAVFGTTEIIADEPGTAYNDLAGVALVLTALALLASGDALRAPKGHSQVLLLAALAAGLALGVKYTFIFAVLALTASIIAFAPGGRRIHTALLWCPVVAAAGGYWYVRNLVLAGNPIPNVHVALGPLRLPNPPSAPAFSVAHFLFNGSVWRADFLPGFSQALGPAWWVLVGIASAGLILGIVAEPMARWALRTAHTSPFFRRPPGDAQTRPASNLSMAWVMAAVGLATVIGYVLTPQPNLPTSFVFDLRFVLLAILMGLLVLPIVLTRSQWVIVLLPAYGLILIATQFANGIWSGGQGLLATSLVAYHSDRDGLVVGVPVFVIGVAIVLAKHADVRWFRGAARIAAVVVVAAALVGGSAVQSFYLAHWYANGPQVRIDRWASTVHHVRIAVSSLILHYPLYGSDLTNDVEFVGTAGTHGAYYAIASCPAWRRAINAGHYQYIVSVEDVLAGGRVPPSATMWTQGDPAAHLLLTDAALSLGGYERISVFAVHGRLQPSGCKA
jgi:hypothetical protein